MPCRNRSARNRRAYRVVVSARVRTFQPRRSRSSQAATPARAWRAGGRGGSASVLARSSGRSGSTRANSLARRRETLPHQRPGGLPRPAQHLLPEARQQRLVAPRPEQLADPGGEAAEQFGGLDGVLLVGQLAGPVVEGEDADVRLGVLGSPGA